jgi:hypothetical protein
MTNVPRRAGSAPLRTLEAARPDTATRTATDAASQPRNPTIACEMRVDTNAIRAGTNRLTVIQGRLGVDRRVATTGSERPLNVRRVESGAVDGRSEPFDHHLGG